MVRPTKYDDDGVRPDPKPSIWDRWWTDGELFWWKLLLAIVMTCAIGVTLAEIGSSHTAGPPVYTVEVQYEDTDRRLDEIEKNLAASRVLLREMGRRLRECSAAGSTGIVLREGHRTRGGIIRAGPTTFVGPVHFMLTPTVSEPIPSPSRFARMDPIRECE